eukprot:c24786_g1_i1 orf=522-2951(+)
MERPPALRLRSLLLLTIAKCTLLCIISAASLMWVLWWMMFSEPPNKDTQYLRMLDKHIHSTFFRTDDYYGSALIYQSAPFVLVALLSYGVIELRKKIKLLAGERKGRERLARPRLTTYPLVAQSPLGVVTAAEVLCSAGLLFVLLYSFGRPTYLYIQAQYKSDPKTRTVSLQLEKLNGASYYMGRAATVSFSLLWIPVSRGSPFLRLINVPYENAIKYHTWLSVLTLFMLSLHSIGYIVYYVLSHTAKEIIRWEAAAESCSVVAGLVAWIVGLIMWASSLSCVRRRWYEVFFGVHHLYIVFVIFWLYHVIWTVHLFIIPCLLFAIDRFLRMVQSRQLVDVLSARIMESGSIELKIARNDSKGIAYHALSSWYLKCPSLSRLLKFQWHFFSVISAGMDEEKSLSIVIKPLGKWTKNLREQVLESTKGASARCPFSFKAAVEGPYGDESDFFLRYNVIVLVGGGIGVTPLLAILQDILWRKRLEEENLPSSIHLYHCVRKQEELCVLNSIDPNLILPHYEKHGLDIRVNAYVTSPSCKIVEEGARKDEQKTLDLATFGGSPIRQPSSNSPDVLRNTILNPNLVNTSDCTPIQGICAISTSGKSKWVVLTIFASIVGFYIIWGLSNVLLVKNYEAPFPNYHRAHLVLASIALGTTAFGGMIILLWWSPLKVSPTKDNGFAAEKADCVLWSIFKAPKKSPSTNNIGSDQNVAHLSSDNHHQELQESLTNDIEDAGSHNESPWNGNLHLQSRPQWTEIFHNLSIEYQGQNIGVLVSGPPSMQQDIAKECQRHSKILKRDSSANIFHFHPINFDL